MATYQEGQWKKFWLGPTNLLFTVMRQDVYRHRETLMKQQSSSCNYCKAPIHVHRGANCDCDHIIPVKYGGSSRIENLQLLCVSCHRVKTGIEKQKQKRIIQFEGAREGCQYVVFGDEEPDMISGGTKPRNFVNLGKGLFEVSSAPGKRRIFGPGDKKPKKTKIAQVSVREHVTQTHTVTRGLSQDQKRRCRELVRVERCDILFTFKDYGYTLRDVKCPDVIRRIRDALETDKISIDYMVIGEVHMKSYRDIRIAIKLRTKRALSIGSSMKKMYMVFPGFRGVIGFDATKGVYLQKARGIVSPLEHVNIDPNPLVFGETLRELLMRIHNAQRKQEGSRGVVLHYTPDMIQAAISSGGSWKLFSMSEIYQTNGKDNPMPFRLCFDKFSC